MVGVLKDPGRSYLIQEKFSRQGVFSVKATLLGANLILLEGSEDGDVSGFVEEAKD